MDAGVRVRTATRFGPSKRPHVAEVQPGTPGAALGLAPGDTIVTIGGDTTWNMPAEAVHARLNAPEGSRVEVSWMHGGRRRRGAMNMVPAPTADVAPARRSPPTPKRRPYAGLRAKNRAGSVGLTLGKRAGDGYRIKRLRKRSVAKRAGVRWGDVVTHVNDTPLSGYGPLDVNRLLRRKVGATLRLTVLRAGQPRTFTMITTRNGTRLR